MTASIVEEVVHVGEYDGHVHRGSTREELLGSLVCEGSESCTVDVASSCPVLGGELIAADDPWAIVGCDPVILNVATEELLVH